MGKPRAVYSLNIGGQRIPFMEVKQSKTGDEYVIFPLNPHGFHLSAHPAINPHLKDRTGFRQDLDLDLLRSIDWDAEAETFRQDMEARAYWPNHRADIIAIPGPRGKSYFEALTELAERGDLDIVRYLKAVLGGGTIYKIGPGERDRFFRTKTGQGSFLFDKKEGCFAVYAPIFPEKPLLRFGGKFGTIRMHPHLESWKGAMDANVDLEWEELTPKYRAQMEEAFQRVAPQVEAFGRKLRIIRWKPGRRGEINLLMVTDPIPWRGAVPSGPAKHLLDDGFDLNSGFREEL